MKTLFTTALGLFISWMTVSPTLGAEPTQTMEPFEFIAFGHTQYSVPLQLQENQENVRRLIQGSKADFLVHLGDTKNASLPCDEATDEKALNFFKSFNKPIIYTPGDNEWADCIGDEVGLEYPASRLKTIRQIYFRERRYKTIESRVSQASVSEKYPEFAENVSWSHNGIRFVTINVPGNNNNAPREGYTWDYFDTRFQTLFKFLFKGTFVAKYFKVTRYLKPGSMMARGDAREFGRRQEANAEWLGYAVDRALENDAAALVILGHGDPSLHLPPRLRNGFNPLLKEIGAAARRFRKPILWVHANTHRFVLDTPFANMGLLDDKPGPELNLVRVIVPGPPFDSYVKIKVKPNDSWPFRVRPRILSENELSR